MDPLDRLPPQLAAQVRERGGLVARRELLEAGLTPGMLRSLTRVVCRVYPGVYDLGRRASALPATDLSSRAWAAHLRLGPASIVAGESALVLHGAELRRPAALRLLVPSQHAVTSVPGLVVERTRRPAPSTRRLGLPVLPVEDAVLRLAVSERHTVEWVTTACQQRLTTASRVRSRLDQLARHPQRALLTALLDDIEAGATTALEVEFRRNVLVRHSLPPGVAQFRVPGRRGPSDVGYEAERLLVELDSIAHHSGTARFADLDRDNENLSDGYATMRFGWLQSTSGACASAVRLRDALLARGGHPTWSACPSCPPEVVGGGGSVSP